MDIQYYGANCLSITIKQNRVVIDDNLAGYGLKSVAKPNDILLFTSPSNASNEKNTRIVIDCPGEYEVGDIAIYGIEAKSFLSDEYKYSTIYKILVNDITLVVIGNIAPELNDAQLEALGMIDVLFIPVGGHDLTLSPANSLKLIREIAPKLVIPTHYGDKGVKYPAEQESLEDALKVLAMEPKESTAKLKLKAADLSETMQLVVLEINQA